MNAEQTTLARKCLEWAEHDSMTFPEIIEALMDGGFDGYMVDYRRRRLPTLPSGESIELETRGSDLAVRETFDPAARKAACDQP
jgi:hypothetical protein